MQAHPGTLGQDGGPVEPLSTGQAEVLAGAADEVPLEDEEEPDVLDELDDEVDDELPEESPEDVLDELDEADEPDFASRESVR